MIYPRPSRPTCGTSPSTAPRAGSSRHRRAAPSSTGIPKGTGPHALRHHYASLLIKHGESVKTVSERLGHTNAAMTLNIYTHLWPDSEERTRAAVDKAYADSSAVAEADTDTAA